MSSRKHIEARSTWHRQAPPESEAMAGVIWGSPDVLFTPAYWRHQAEISCTSRRDWNHRLGDSLKAECVACLLGGHGIPAEVGLAAFNRFVASGLIEKRTVTYDEVFATLAEPLSLSTGRTVRYRFANQKSACLTELLNGFEEPRTENCVAVRNWLTAFRGIGLKTASWIIRNWYSSDDVAILDIHIYRAGLLAGFFEPSATVSRHYLELEQRYLTFAHAIGVRPSLLDAVIWQQMKQAGSLVHRLLSC